MHAKENVIVKFCAEWCTHCKMFKAVYEEVAEEYGDKIKFTTMDIDGAEDLARKYGVQGVPSVVLFHHGETMATNPGNMNKTDFIAFLEKHFGKF